MLCILSALLKFRAPLLIEYILNTICTAIFKRADKKNQYIISLLLTRIGITAIVIIMEIEQLKNILEAAILAAGEPVSLERLSGLFPETDRPAKSLLKQALLALESDYLLRGIRLKQVASGYSFHTPTELSGWIKGLWPEKRPRYTHAFLETLAIIAYKQPVTRGDIEAIRGVSVSPTIIKALLEQEWIQSVGQREVPGRPNLYATTKPFLDHFNLQSLEALPVLLPIASDTKEDQQLESSDELLKDS